MSNIIFPYKTIKDVDVAGKTILLRADYNVPLADDGHITDDFRIEASLPTLNYLLERGAKLVIVSHLGRPKGQVNPKFSLSPVATSLSTKLDRPVKFVSDCIGAEVLDASDSMKSGDVVLLENLRFHPEEEKNDRDFAEELARSSRAQLFVQDGFGVVHRPHASTAAITEFLPSVAGLLLEREYTEIKGATDNPNRPLTAVIGGAKISDKMPLVEKFIEIADNVVVGGALANNFLKFLGHDVADSLVEDGSDDLVKTILDTAHAKYGNAFDEKFILPRDVAISKDGTPDGIRQEVSLDGVTTGHSIYDIGEKTINVITRLVESSGTVVWNGTLGLAEKTAFSRGSARLAMALAQHPQVVSVIGGGDTVDFVRNWDVLRGGSFTHVSTGGGASLELMSGDTLPGIAVLLPR